MENHRKRLMSSTGLLSDHNDLHFLGPIVFESSFSWRNKNPIKSNFGWKRDEAHSLRCPTGARRRNWKSRILWQGRCRVCVLSGLQICLRLRFSSSLNCKLMSSGLVCLDSRSLSLSSLLIRNTCVKFFTSTITSTLSFWTFFCHCLPKASRWCFSRLDRECLVQTEPEKDFRFSDSRLYGVISPIDCLSKLFDSWNQRWSLARES